MRLYYMTSNDIATNYILPERRMKLSRFADLNDPFELQPHCLDDKELRAMNRVLQTGVGERFGLLCLSDNWRSPVMWAHYADKHKGVCLGFDFPEAPDTPTVRRVEYNPARIRFKLDRTATRYGIDESYIEALLFTKAKEWAYEREWRTLSGLHEQDATTGFYYVDFGPQLQLREVIVGARNPTPVGQMAKLVRKNQASVQVLKARPAFQEFAMVRNKAVKAINVPAAKA